MDVLVVGGGPAGMALAAACARRGLDTGLVDPAPDRPWPATYGMWSAELPGDLPDSVVAARAAGRAIALTEHDLGWKYAVLDIPALHAHFAGKLTDVDVRSGRVVDSTQPGTVTLADGSMLRARVVVDAAGRWRPLHARSTRRIAAEQTAYGLVLDEDAAAPLVKAGQALFMDWRADHGETGWPTFLYVIPLGGGEVLVEETSLARRPGLPLSTLRRRLYARLAHHDIPIPKQPRSERVSFPVDQPRHHGAGVLGFGAAAPLVHPATGFSVAASLQLAPIVAATLAAHLPHEPTEALTAAQRVVWSPSARLVHRLRRIGLEALLRMPADEIPGFFERFFALPETHRWTYLTSRDDVRANAATLSHLFRVSDARMRRRLVLPAVLPPLRSNVTLRSRTADAPAI
ncbi:lycopene cyclase family protein [Mycobacterium sp. pV006]|uniref:lycopene cyclase family protein n=1 Tax=Mycobacterium sp. pV006 TaxID=3238983 RepID=UPI00351AC6B1